MLELPAVWDGPYSAEQVVSAMDDAGYPPAYSGDDYGLYQTYGTHILCGPDTLLYIGRATEQTFSARFRQHQLWLRNEDPVQVYLGRISLRSDMSAPTIGPSGQPMYSSQNVF